MIIASCGFVVSPMGSWNRFLHIRHWIIDLLTDSGGTLSSYRDCRKPQIKSSDFAPIFGKSRVESES